jgi:hypothetical protein
MALTAPRTIFGIHEFAPYSRTTGLPYGVVRVLENSSIGLSGELIELQGGSLPYSWDVANGNINVEISIALKEYPNFLFELFLGKAPTDTSTSSTGTVMTALTNKQGTSVVSATTGVASVGAKSGAEASMKFGKYVVKAVSATTVDVYALSSVDFARGTDKEFENDALKITASALTITTSTAVEIPGFGIELTGGSGTIGMTENDTAIFEIAPPHTGTMDVNIGSTSDVYPEFGAVMTAEQKGTGGTSGELFDIEAYRVKAIGLPIGLNRKAWSESEVTAKAFYDSALNRVLRIRHVKAS